MKRIVLMVTAIAIVMIASTTNTYCQPKLKGKGAIVGIALKGIIDNLTDNAKGKGITSGVIKTGVRPDVGRIEDEQIQRLLDIEREIKKNTERKTDMFKIKKPDWMFKVKNASDLIGIPQEYAYKKLRQEYAERNLGVFSIVSAYGEHKYEEVTEIVSRYGIESFDNRLILYPMIIDSYAKLSDFVNAYGILDKYISKDSSKAWDYIVKQSSVVPTTAFVDTIASRFDRNYEHASSDQINFVFSTYHKNMSNEKIMNLYQRIKGSDLCCGYPSYIAGLKYYASHDYNNTIECMNNAIDRSYGDNKYFPVEIDSATAHCVRGLSYIKNLKLENAVADINMIPDSALQSLLSSFDANYNDVLTMCAIVNKSTGNYEKAISQYENLLLHDDENSELLYQIGDCYMQIGQTDEAREKLIAAIEKEKNSDNYNVIPWAYLALGDKKTAEKCAKRILRNKSLDFDHYIFGGSFFEQLGKERKATAYYKKAYEFMGNIQPYEKQLIDFKYNNSELYGKVFL